MYLSLWLINYKKRVLSVILSHSTTRIGYKHPVNCHVKNPKHNYVCYMSRAQKQCYNLIFKCFLLYNFSALKHSDTKIRSDLVTPPDFFHAFPYLPWEQLFRQRLLCRQNQEKKKKSILINFRRVMYLGDIFISSLHFEERQCGQVVSPHFFKHRWNK